MGLNSLKIVGKYILESAIVRYLLAFDLSSEQQYGCLRDAVLLTTISRLRRNKPYACCFLFDPDSRAIDETDWQVIKSLPTLPLIYPRDGESFVYLAECDLTPLLPEDEDDFVLLLSELPETIPTWPDRIIKLNGISIGVSDEFMTLCTIDPETIALVDNLPRYQP